MPGGSSAQPRRRSAAPRSAACRRTSSRCRCCPADRSPGWPSSGRSRRARRCPAGGADAAVLADRGTRTSARRRRPRAVLTECTATIDSRSPIVAVDQPGHDLVALGVEPPLGARLRHAVRQLTAAQVVIGRDANLRRAGQLVFAGSVPVHVELPHIDPVVIDDRCSSCVPPAAIMMFGAPVAAAPCRRGRRCSGSSRRG